MVNVVRVLFDGIFQTRIYSGGIALNTKLRAEHYMSHIVVLSNLSEPQSFKLGP